LDSDYHANITNDAYGVSTLNNDPAYEQELFNGDDDRMIATVMPDGNHLIFTWPSPNINYSQFAGIAMSGLTNDFVSNFFWFQPTSPMPSNVPVTVRCRIITNTYAARLASGLQSNQTVTVNALQRTDMLVVSNIIARMTAGQTTNVTAPVELVTLGLSSLGSVGPPAAIFSGSPTNGPAPLSVTFADTFTGSITNRFWSFGDGGTTNTTATSVHYVYQTTGSYQVSLIVSGLGGSNTNTKPNYIVVGSATPPPPVASFTNNPASGPAPLTVYFYDTSTGSPTGWAWAFGDASGTSTSQNPNYTYDYPGTYIVTQIVANASGSSTNHATITVSCPTITLSPNGANPTVLAGGTEGLAYNTQTITASGGAAPYAYAVTGGSLAGSGLTLSSAGTLSGASPVAGTYTFTVTATDTNNCPGSQAYSVTVLTQFASWEQFYNLSGTLTSGNASYTGDGMSNTNKYMAGFSPANAAAYLHVISIAEQFVAGNTNVVVTYLGANGDNSYVPGIASRTNVLDYTTGDANGNYTNGGWQDTYQTNILSGGNGSGTITSMTDSNVTASPDLYYRVRVLLP
jgi:PKD repeat protein